MQTIIKNHSVFGFFWVVNFCSVILSTKHDDNSTFLKTIGNKCGTILKCKSKCFSVCFFSPSALLVVFFAYCFKNNHLMFSKFSIQTHARKNVTSIISSCFFQFTYQVQHYSLPLVYFSILFFFSSGIDLHVVHVACHAITQSPDFDSILARFWRKKLTKQASAAKDNELLIDCNIFVWDVAILKRLQAKFRNMSNKSQFVSAPCTTMCSRIIEMDASGYGCESVTCHRSTKISTTIFFVPQRHHGLILALHDTSKNQQPKLTVHFNVINICPLMSVNKSPLFVCLVNYLL